MVELLGVQRGGERILCRVPGALRAIGQAAAEALIAEFARRQGMGAVRVRSVGTDMVFVLAPKGTAEDAA